MNKTVKENIQKDVKILKENLKLPEEMFQKIYGVSKEIGITNVLNCILLELEK